MSKEFKDKIKFLSSCAKRKNPLQDSDNEKRFRLLKDLHEDELIKFSPIDRVSKNAEVRITDKGEEHLMKIKNRGLYRLWWVLVPVIVAGAIAIIKG